MKGTTSMRAMVLAGLFSVLYVGVTGADPTWLGGEGPPFVFAADGTGATHLGDTLTVVLAVGGRYHGDATASFRLSVPPSLTLLAGDTAREGRLSAIAGNYTLKLLMAKAGAFDITGSLHITADQQRDDAAFRMSVMVRPDTVIAEHSQYTRLESQRGGGRYRYGDWWLVPLDSTETPAVERTLDISRTRARATQVARSLCRDCAVATTAVDSVRFVVIVGPDGKVRDSRVLASPSLGRTPDPDVVAAAKQALLSSVFQPARIGSEPVSDWLYVTIPVQRETR
jgi:hypothetical protein